MNKETLGQYLRRIRTERNLSMGELASKIGVTTCYLSYIECDVKSNPSCKIMVSLFAELNMNKEEIEKFFDLHAKANGCVSYDIVQYIMEHDEIRKAIRSERDAPDAVPNWNDFISSLEKYNG